MVHKIFCATRFGIEAKKVEVELSFIRGLPNFTISGLANNSIQESKQRIQSTLNAYGFVFPPLRVIVNLFPSDLPKYGSHFDLPIALLIALHKNQQAFRHKWFAFGELGLDGNIKHNDSLFPLVLSVLTTDPDAYFILPKDSKKSFSYIPNLHAVYVCNFKEALEILKTDEAIESSNANLEYPYITIENKKFFYQEKFEYDFGEVIGQNIAKRAAMIAAAGFHNIIFEGSPGCGKSMIIKRLREILPPMSLEEIIETAKLKGLEGIDINLVPLRNFRFPHQSASKASIIGSASQREPKPGEIALAHLGLLFFDELPYFHKEILEALREPLENNALVVSRVHSKIEYPTSFIFAAAQNPCPCGNLLSTIKECRCSDREITQYKNRLSEPFLDRIDLFVQMQENQSQIKNQEQKLDSKAMRDKVFKAFVMQHKRLQKDFNGKLSEKEIEKFCGIDTETESVLLKAKHHFGLSMRSINKIKKVARTIADLDECHEIKKQHILEAMSYRRI